MIIYCGNDRNTSSIPSSIPFGTANREVIISIPKMVVSVALRIKPPNGEYLQEIIAIPITDTEKGPANLFKVTLPEQVTSSLPGRVLYQVFAYAEGGEKIPFEEGSFNIRKSVPIDEPKNVGELKEYNINQLYELLVAVIGNSNKVTDIENLIGLEEGLRTEDKTIVGAINDLFLGGGGGGAPVDPTLTEEGFAAEAKVTGEKITALEDRCQSLEAFEKNTTDTIQGINTTISNIDAQVWQNDDDIEELIDRADAFDDKYETDSAAINTKINGLETICQQLEDFKDTASGEIEGINTSINDINDALTNTNLQVKQNDEDIDDLIERVDALEDTPGSPGNPGVGIADIKKTKTEGLVDTYTITLTDGTTKTFTVTNGSKGDTGKGFSITRTYQSVAAMNNDYANSAVKVGDFVLIDTGNVEDADNAKWYVKTENGFSYLGDLSGSQGVRGNGISNIQYISDGFDSTSGRTYKEYQIAFTDQSFGSFSFFVYDGKDADPAELDAKLESDTKAAQAKAVGTKIGEINDALDATAAAIADVSLKVGEEVSKLDANKLGKTEATKTYATQVYVQQEISKVASGGLQLDTKLTEEGRAADAKAVGDAIAEKADKGEIGVSIETLCGKVVEAVEEFLNGKTLFFALPLGDDDIEKCSLVGIRQSQKVIYFLSVVSDAIISVNYSATNSAPVTVTQIPLGVAIDDHLVEKGQAADAYETGRRFIAQAGLIAAASASVTAVEQALSTTQGDLASLTTTVNTNVEDLYHKYDDLDSFDKSTLGTLQDHSQRITTLENNKLVIDGNLATPGQAADAGAVGAEFQEIYTNIDDIQKDVAKNESNITDLYGKVGNLETNGGGSAQEITTINGKPLKFFVGQQAEFDALTEEQKENAYAIITDDNAQEEVIESLGKLEEWKDQAKVYTNYYNDMYITKGTSIELGNLPSNRSLNDIVGLGLEVGLVTETYDAPLRFSGGKTRSSMYNPTNGRYEVPFNLTVSLMSSASAFGIANMDVILGSKNGKLYLTFDNGSYCWFTKNALGLYDTDSEWLNGGNFSLEYACYWFA